MRVRPLLRNSRHRAKITPVRIALEWELSIDWKFNPMLWFMAGLPNLFNIAGHFHMGYLLRATNFCDVTIGYCDVKNPLILISFMR